jgi:lycopene cyclase domain-containing protein
VLLDAKWIGKFIAVYGVLLIPFSVVNGILTGSLLPSPIVWYNDAHNLGVRIGTIPVEDIFYGFLLILLFVFIYEKNSRGTKIS